MLDEVIVALAKAVDAKDPYTNGHSVRVAKYSRMLAQRLGLPDHEVERIHRMAVLHDVGKIGVPDEILKKPGKLTPEEYKQIQGHTVNGDRILRGITSMPRLHEGARWHHERVDGLGYPDKLSGGDIPLEARIIGVADSYDAMTSDRVYRKHLPQEVVREELVHNMGTQFDPDVARAMLEIMDEDPDYELHG
jgi:putative nucleotidyltransferase with HDIG domain